MTQLLLYEKRKGYPVRRHDSSLCTQKLRLLLCHPSQVNTSLLQVSFAHITQNAIHAALYAA